MKITTKQLKKIIQEEILKEEWTDALDPKQVLDKAKKAAAMAADDGKIDPKAAVAPEEQPKEEPKEQPKELTAEDLIKLHIKLVTSKLQLLPYPERREIRSKKGKKSYYYTPSLGAVIDPLTHTSTGMYWGPAEVGSVRSVSRDSSARKALHIAYKKAIQTGLGRVFVSVIKPGGTLKAAHTAQGVAPSTTGTAQKTGSNWMFFAAGSIGRVKKGEERGAPQPQGKVIEIILSLDAKGQLIFIPHPDPTNADWSSSFK